MSLYLKYRPQDFDNLVWQKFVNDTLKTAIKEDKLVGAYLFCGPRWTWKTTTARLLAKTINCRNPKDWNPCLECDICKEFLEERLVDIIEIDAASNTWVDNIREIIDKANFSPTKAKYKVYIIDEVHMLSKGAFNALLKILEEPPSHVKFILATTETHKVPETIISRCQRYDFKRITNEDIIARLKYISSKEWIEADEESYNYIANHSNWGLRNAISLYEQLIQDKKIIFNNVIEKLWLIWEKELDDFLNLLINKDSQIISNFDKLIESGKNIKLFFKELIFHTKDKIIDKLSKKEPITNYLKIIETLDETYAKTKNSLDENTTLLIWILKILDDWNNPIEVKITPTETIKKTTKIEDIKPIKAEKIQEPEEYIQEAEELTEEDIVDTFFQMNKNNYLSQEEKSKEEEKDFNDATFISNLKKSWAKGVLVFSLRGSSIKLRENHIEIKTQTQISRRNIASPESIESMKQTLLEMWYPNLDIKVI